MIVKRVASRRLLSSVRYYGSKENNLIIRAKMHEHPGKVFLVEDVRTITYGEFLSRSGQFAAHLNTKYGIGKGDRVLARVTKTTDNLALYVACLRLGAVYVPVNPAYTEKEADHYLTDAEPKLLVTCDEKTDLVFAERVKVVRENTLAKESLRCSPAMDVESVQEHDIACVCYTSGTTGKAKGAMLTHGSLSANAEALVEQWNFTTADRNLHMLPFYHVHGMFISLNCSIFSHSTVIWRDRFTIDDTLKWMPQSTVVMGVPTYYSRLLTVPDLDIGHHRNVRLFVCGSAPLSLDILNKFKERTRKTIVERYGMTEALVITANSSDPSGNHPGSVGRPLGGTKVRLNPQGVLEVKSDSLFSGYWRNPEKTKEEFTEDGYFNTGDVGRIDERGYVHILGRSKDLVISGGLNVYPKEIEDAIDKMPEVAESAVVGISHKDLGEGVTAVVALRESYRSEDMSIVEQRIIQRLRETLSGYKVPKRVVFVPALPRNQMSKVQKNVLRLQFKDVYAQAYTHL